MRRLPNIAIYDPHEHANWNTKYFLLGIPKFALQEISKSFRYFIPKNILIMGDA